MKCFYHNDLDGRSSGAIINRFREGKEVGPCDFIEMEYSKDFPLDSITPGERIYIVDFHIQRDEDFRKLQEITENITLIDHHKSTSEHLLKHPELYFNIEAIINSNRSGCWLTWDYFRFWNDNQPLPEALKLIDDMDRWIWQYGDKTSHFCEGIKLYPHQPQDPIWDELLRQDNDRMIDLIAEGKICVQYSKMICDDYVSLYGFETEFEGYKAFAQGFYRYGAKVFGERIKQYPLLLSFEFTGKKWIIGLYSETIDVSKIAVKHGGGGHERAAGFTTLTFPF